MSSIIFSDNFTGTNGTLLENHTPDIDISWVRLAGSTSLGELNNSAVQQQSGFSTSVYTVNPGTVDTSVQAALLDTGNLNALLCRVTNVSNYYFIILSTANFDLSKRVAGVNTILGSSPDSSSIGDTFKLQVVGNSLSVYKNGVLKISVLDSSLVSGAGGMRFSDSGTKSRSGSFVGTDDTPAPDRTSLLNRKVSQYNFYQNAY